MRQSEAAVLFGIFMLFISIPIIPHTFYIMIDHFVFNIIFIIVIVFSLYKGPLIGIPVFLLIGALVIERNHRVWIWANQQLRKTPASPAPRMEEDKEMPVSAEVFYVEDEKPDVDTYDFKPQKDTGSNDFISVGSSINYKKVMESSPLGEVAKSLF
jgi:hypothetical protein